VFGDVEVDSAEGVVRNWDAIKRDESGSIFGDLPETLPALLYARKVIRRASNAGLAGPAAGASPSTHSESSFDAIGQRLFELVAEARELDVDPELALRTYARRFMEGATE
jgi:uncharacterized protein YabN with tetrapyrrole methylase and pyrophosphatase domain